MKQKSKILNMIWLLAIALYGLHPSAIFAAQKTANIAAVAIDSITTVTLTSPVQILNLRSNVLTSSCSGEQIIVGNGSYEAPQLQNSFFEIRNNNFAQQAYELNPNLSADCLEISLGSVPVQNMLAVQQTNQNNTIAVKKALALNPYSYQQGQGSDTAVFSIAKTETFGTVYAAAMEQKIAVSDVAVKNIQSEYVVLRGFEILRC
jgi:hypothetical protein